MNRVLTPSKLLSIQSATRISNLQSWAKLIDTSKLSISVKKLIEKLRFLHTRNDTVLFISYQAERKDEKDSINN